MDQYVDNRQREILWDLLANPADNGVSYMQSLERLVKDNPQSGLLQVLLARTGSKQQLSKAAVYFNPRTLHKLINYPQSLAVVEDESIIRQAAYNADTNQNYFNAGIVTESDNLQEPFTDVSDEPENKSFTDADVEQAEIITSPPDEHTPEAIIAEPVEVIEEQEQVENHEASIVEETEAPQLVDEPILVEDDGLAKQEVEEAPVEEIAELPQATTDEEKVDESEQNELVTDTFEDTSVPAPPVSPNTYSSRFPKHVVPVTDTIEPELTLQEPQNAQNDIEDDVYDEIVGIEEIGFTSISREEPETTEQPVTEARFSVPAIETSPEEEEASEVLFHQPQGVADAAPNHSKTIDEEERLIFGGIVNTDYLSFDKKIDELRAGATQAQPVQNITPVEENITETTQQTGQPEIDTTEVSRYDDDTMPYTFMWWLNKTRKEHAESLRPYASDTRVDAGAAKGRHAKIGGGNELQQQYYENIFSLTSVSGIDREPAPEGVAFDANKKEDVIIERFIHTEPQIKPLSADKLDNENKAKKSSEDLNDFVTETLARIYTDQMLYHKAIATYKKLILKFPEKKLYFAAQIEQLEKKTN